MIQRDVQRRPQAKDPCDLVERIVNVKVAKNSTKAASRSKRDGG
jgi:hypothetical protein